MMPGRIIPEMAASRSIPYRRLCQNQRVPTSDAMRPLSADGLFQCRDTLRTNLMNDAAKLLDPLTEPSQLFFAYLVMPGIARLGVGFLQFLKHRAIAACVFGPRSEESRLGKECGSTCSSRWLPCH